MPPSRAEPEHEPDRNTQPRPEPRPLELWTPMVAIPGHVASIAKRAEAAGWYGVTITDSQNLAGDAYVAMSVAASATTTLRVSTGVTNPFTRHPAVAAAALWHLQIESAGRAGIGLGRGDSSLAHLGMAPAPVGMLDDYLTKLQAYLRGEAVPLDWSEVTTLAVAERPAESRLRWLALRASLEKPPVFVVGSGPKVLRLAAEKADRVVLAVGADPQRVRWAVDLVRSVRADVPVGAFVNTVVDDDPERARALVAGGVASFARFSAMHGHASGPLPDEQRSVIESIPKAYDLERHFQSAPHSEGLPPGFVDAFAVVGPPALVVERFCELAELGIDQFHVVGPTGDVDPGAARTARRRFTAEVLPELA
ncbi:MAG TPA: LLM class flavin-dependent oxidoreductase [Acidimicrobiales bacterium]|nr:LLM class flavin-dependent oxidoreductase [Acidimicrobiales bacterium]